MFISCIIYIWQHGPNIQMGAQNLIVTWAAGGEHLQGTVSTVMLKSGIQAQGQFPNKVRQRVGRSYLGKESSTLCWTWRAVWTATLATGPFNTHECIHTHMHTYMYTNMHTHTYTFTQVHRSMHACMCKGTHIPHPLCLIKYRVNLRDTRHAAWRFKKNSKCETNNFLACAKEYIY